MKLTRDLFVLSRPRMRRTPQVMVLYLVERKLRCFSSWNSVICQLQLQRCVSHLQFRSAELKTQMHFLPSTLCDVLSMCAELSVFAYVKVLLILNLCSAKRNATPVFNVILCLYHRRNAASTTCSFISALRFFLPFVYGNLK